MNFPPYVVSIIGKRKDGRLSTGTGFIVDTIGHVVTCWHLVSEADEITVHLSQKTPRKYRIHKISEADDLVLLESIMSTSIETPVASLHPNWKKDTFLGDSVTVWGFSAIENNLTSQMLNCQLNSFSEKQGIILTGDFNLGYSGAPVVNANGKVIGIVQAVHPEHKILGMAIPISHLFNIFQPEINGKKRIVVLNELINDVNKSRFAVSGFSADIGTGYDLIGIGDEVDAFAYLIAAKALKPPIAIGLFGNWGSGKSFFMEAMRQRVHKITADAQKSGQPQKEISIYKYIAQIEFNAWHYVEGDLWASLVEHIFRNLRTGPEDEPSLLQERQKVVIEKLENRQQVLEEVLNRQADLEKQLTDAEKTLIKLESERDKALKELNKVRIKGIIKEIKLSDEEKENIRQTLVNLGVMTPQTEVTNEAELIQGVDELRIVLERGNALITPLREHGWKWAIAMIVIILIIPLTSFILSWVSKIPPVTNALFSVSAFLSGLTVMLTKGTVWLSNAQARVSAIHLQLEEKRNDAKKQYENKICEVKREYKQLDADYNKVKNEKKETECEIEKLKLEIQQITPGRVLLDFINERACSQDYSKHLGITAQIRNDFEQLSDLICRLNIDFEKNDDGKRKDENIHKINRIILYIDDLDRCPPDRVVQVLQAVHLLLAFPLFVVVVAVDARWLSQSLQVHYQNLLATSTLREGFEVSKEFGNQASPQDYLEKIFQVPFWVRPLPEKARMRIVKGLVSESMTKSVGEENVKKQLRNEQTNAEDIDNSKVDEKRVVYWEASELKRPLNLKAMTDLKPQSLNIEEIELQFMDELSSLLGQTPRSVKRFVNVYRLIRAISLNHETKFVEDMPDANFKLVLFLLAILTGLPSISREFFTQLREENLKIEQSYKLGPQAPLTSKRTLAQVLEALREGVLGTPQTLPSSQVLVGKRATVTLENAGTDPANGRGYGDWNAYYDLERLESWLNQYEGGSWLNFNVIAFADLAPQVVRFSFRIEEL